MPAGSASPEPSFRQAPPRFFFANDAPLLRRGSFALFAFVALCMLLALWLVWPAFDPGHIVNLDAPRHLLRAEVMARQFLPSGHVDGWSPWWFLGAQLFLFQSYGYFALIGATAILADGLASLEAVFKLYYVLPVVVLPLVTAQLAARLGATTRACAAAALASLIFSSPLGYGVEGIFGIGLLLQGAGVAAFALAWPELLAALDDRRRAPWLAVLLSAFVLLLHFISGAYLLAVAGLVAAGLAIESRSLSPLLRYALVAIFVLLLAGHALFPSLEHRELAGVAVGWGDDRARWLRFLKGELFGPRLLSLAAILAALWCIARGPRLLAISAAVYLATGLVAGSDSHALIPLPLEKLFGTLFRPRALPYATLFQAVFAGVAIDLLAASGARFAGERGFAEAARAASLATAAVFALLVFEAARELPRQRHYVRTTSSLDARDHRVYRRLVEWLREHAERPAIVALPRTLLPMRATGARSMISLLNVDSGLYTLSGDQAELAKHSRTAGRVDLDTIDDNLPRNAATLRRAGVSYVLLGDADLRRRLQGNSELELVFEVDQQDRSRGSARHRHRSSRDPLGAAVYRLRGGGQRLHGPAITVHGMKLEPERIAWLVDSREHETQTAIAALNYHPNWQATVDGEPAKTWCSAARRVALDVPPGKDRRVVLEFVRPLREKLYNALSLIALLAVGALWWRRRAGAA